MDEILKNLQSPGWWFTAVFVAILVSLFAGFLNDRFNRWLSESWAWYRQRRAATLARKEREIEFLSREPVILTLYSSETVTFLVFTLLFLILTLLLMVWSQSMLSSPELAASFMNSHPGRIIWILTSMAMMFVLVLLATLISFITGIRLSVITQAYRRLYRRKFAEFERNTAPPEST